MDNPTLRRLTGALTKAFIPWSVEVKPKLPHKHRADSRHMVIAERLKKGDVLEVSQIKRDYPSWNDPYSPLTRAIELLKAEGVLVRRLNVGTHKRYYVEQ